MGRKVHYIGYCISSREQDEYKCNVAGNLKIHYIANAAKRAGLDLTVLSMCSTIKPRFCRRKATNDDDLKIVHIASFGQQDPLHRALNLLLLYFQLISYYLFYVKKEDLIILYHSVRVTGCVAKLLRLVKKPVILEVEEIYAYAADGVKSYRDREIDSIKRYNDFIFVNGYIPKFLGIPEQQYMILYGAYQPVEMKMEKVSDGNVHVVYAGAIEKLNKGAFTAVEAAEFFPDRYRLHIIGKGEPHVLAELEERIRQVNSYRSEETISYDGFMSGKALDEFLCKCDIGLGTYKIQEGYSDFVFPSKLMSYMCHNLKIVTGRSKCYEDAVISRDWFFYDSNNGESIAQAVVKAASSSIDRNSSIQLLTELDRQFVSSLSEYKKGR